MNVPIKTTLHTLVMFALVLVAPQLRAAPQEADTYAPENDVASPQQIWANDVDNPRYDPTTGGGLYLLGPRYIVSEDESRATFDWLHETIQASVSGTMWFVAVDYAGDESDTDMAQDEGIAALQEFRVFEVSLEAVQLLDPTDPILQRIGMRLDRTMVSSGTFDPRDNSVEFELWLTGDEGPLPLPMPVQVRGEMHADRLILVGDTGESPDYTRMRFSISASAADFERQDSSVAGTFVQGTAQRAGALGGSRSETNLILTGPVDERAANETGGKRKAARRVADSDASADIDAQARRPENEFDNTDASRRVAPSYDGRKPRPRKEDRDG